MKVYIVILNYNTKEDTIELLSSLKKINKDGIDLYTLVIDNHSREPISVDEASYKDIGLKLILNSKNLGFTGGCNVGIRYALDQEADSVLLLNSDTLVDQEFLKILTEAASESGEGIYCPKIYFAKGFEFHKEKYKAEDLGKVIWYAGGEIDWKNVYASHRGVDEVDHGQYDSESETNFATGCCFLITRQVLEKTGLFDDKYFLYYEDIDLSLRARSSGFKIHFIPKSFIWHKNAGSTGGSGSQIQDYFLARNRMLFGTKFAPARAKIALVKEGLRLLRIGRPMQKKGVKDFFAGKFGKGSIEI